MGRASVWHLDIPPFIIGDAEDEDVTAGVSDLKVSDPEHTDVFQCGHNLNEKGGGELHGCAMYSAVKEEDGTVLLAMDFHGELNVTSIGVMSNMEIAKKVARLLVSEHHSKVGELSSCKFFTDPNANARYLVAGICPRGDEDS